MLHEVEARFDAALQEFWCIRREQAAKQRAAGKSDKGGRSAVTGGLHLDALGGLVHALLVDAGVADTDVRLKKALELPGYYRPEKQWDLLVLVDGELVPALAGTGGAELREQLQQSLRGSDRQCRGYLESVS